MQLTLFCRTNPFSSKVTRFFSVNGASAEHSNAPGLNVNGDCKGGGLLVSFFFRPSLCDAALVFHPSRSFRSWEFPIAQAFSGGRPSLGAGALDAGEGAPVHPRAAELQRIVNTNPRFMEHVFSAQHEFEAVLLCILLHWLLAEGRGY